MILGRGNAQNDEAILYEYQQVLQDSRQVYSPSTLKIFGGGAAAVYRRMGKPIGNWSEEDILALYQDRQSATWHVYNAFFAFLFFREYCQATIHLLMELRGKNLRYSGDSKSGKREKCGRVLTVFYGRLRTMK